MLDSLDMKIISVLQKDARITFADIARELEVSPGLVQARFYRMKKAGVIKGSTLIVNTTKMGKTFTASIGIKTIESELDEVNNYVKGLKIEKARIFSWTTFGRYNISMAIFSKDLLEVHKIKQLIKQHPAVLEVSISLAAVNLNDNLAESFEELELKKLFKE
ncbi:MAG: Lrp/AsnC family transcriptional regulator [Candidatus Bathyarchaeota archaeon]|nr:Lrp/AsnC family transcriptional regulator [Candidatus Bathyarchaeota archaeon]